MSTSVNIDFGPNKSQILRGVAIMFMIALHNRTLPEFKICVPIFTFLVGYGYAFAKEKNLRHAVKRSWHLLSHFWLILLGICLPVSILAGGFKPTLSNVIPELFGLESELNWYSWYIYFYLWAMIVMIPLSHVIRRFKIPGILVMICCCFGLVYLFHLIPNWTENIWIQAIHDCVLCSPPMFMGFYLADGVVTKIKVPQRFVGVVLCLAVMTATFAFRAIPYSFFIDWITVPIFCIATVALFNIVLWNPLHRLMIALGKESMNIWFLHALFATTGTNTVFGPLIDWVTPLWLRILIMVIVSYFMAKICTAVYNKLC